MASVQLDKIQLRRGLAADLPGQPTSHSPLTFAPGLDEGEPGFTTDQGRLFIGTSPSVGMPSFEREDFPYQNTEVLTENSPPTVITRFLADNQTGFIQSIALTISSSFLTLRFTDPATQLPNDFLLDISGAGASAQISYFVFDSSNHPIRHGRLSILWNTNMSGAPLCVDEAQVDLAVADQLQWQAALIGSIGNHHVVLQYINQTGDTPTVYFRVDRLHP